MRFIFKILLVVFVCMVIFGGAEVTGVLTHMWHFVLGVVHSKVPAINLKGR